jgi:hypothetical protein
MAEKKGYLFITGKKLLKRDLSLAYKPSLRILVL